jgi:hypothetical protein
MFPLLHLTLLQLLEVQKRKVQLLEVQKRKVQLLEVQVGKSAVTTR